MPLSNIEPQIIWKNFSKLNAIPRPSKKEARVIEFIKTFGESLGLPTTVDPVGNVIIKKPATAGMEDRKAIILQSHLDMVCQKNNDTNFDFDTEGIKMKIEGDWVKAEGTTLGADNGLGVASIMSILESNDIPHPALEALFTIDEETGMTGALGLVAGQLEGDILLNLDTEEDDAFSIGCAGGVDVTATQTYELTEGSGDAVMVKISGLQGGHSGMDIHKGFGNANVLLGRFLHLDIDDIQLISIDGGGLRNAIPREAAATFYCVGFEDYQEAFEELKEAVMAEFKSIEAGLKIELLKADTTAQALSTEDSSMIVYVLKALHNGVYRMSPDIENLVEASNNLSRVSLKDGALSIQCLTRSSVTSTKVQVAEQLQSVFELADMSVSTDGDYPGWKPNVDSAILKVMVDLYTQKFGQEPHVEACHAGLECGIIGAHYPEMEMISFGPTIKGAHSPEERASISSTQKFWGFLKDILANIPKK
ncbi:cytosol nonspecific dipeptidase [Taibaiella sp. KBW10]|uniref:aminoacyl-histidine dipeptidase n=1 Tax=Taibaiella sp. KBW10 TaxID=2153357 RepID=UPI000F5A29E2|nr:aminoacyl-histidine dipeptidase [Taibaiella sp. KBW10]RQO31507.1 cytosol nonspecific dipeptidase [Taibaiella sp. KBW10]